ncbi:MULTISPECIES: acyl-CoA thioesterase [Cytobacillus]|uniref:Acyl-CoA thioesterase n=1 Tax=Cytobacillus stercorigallinarum TaxID=2762240 RepID=A0ABR8QVQ9_9BACI|nr:acyl-CoA thioesterase [Cytobacillus stercorigallinarum]MBD7939631.1 acyl-CoA thioesterase [Cytobacillus stercorigallinarum]
MKEIKTSIVVRESDIDELGHMNYLKYFDYFECGIDEWFLALGLSVQYLQSRHIGCVIKKVESEYITEALVGERLEITTTLTRVGHTSFVIFQQMTSRNQKIIATSEKVFVMFHLQTRKAIPVIKTIASAY